MALIYRKFAVIKEKNVLVFHAPGKTKEFNPFVLYKTFYGALDDTVCIDWTSDSRYLNTSPTQYITDSIHHQQSVYRLRVANHWG